MQTKTLYKQLLEVEDALRLGAIRKAYKRLREVLEKVEYRLKKEEAEKVDGKLVQHLMGWYLKLWEEKPPEFYRYPKRWKDVIGRELKFLINLYTHIGKDIEVLKKEYEAFKASPQIKNKSLNFFRSYFLPTVDERVREYKKWTSKDYERGIDYYLTQGTQKEDLPL